MKNIKIIILTLAIMLIISPIAFAQTVSNVSVNQVGNMVEIAYDIDNFSSEVKLTVSTDGGKSFSPPLIKITGDIVNVQPGRHKIVWDVLSEMESFCGDNIVFNVVANSVCDYVDLGLSVKWATCNINASTPEDSGGYYQWAGLFDYSGQILDPDINCPYSTRKSIRGFDGWTKYTLSSHPDHWSGSGFPDNKIRLELTDDIAHVILGGKWRIPTDEEWAELRENCIWTWTTVNGVNGYKIKSKKVGYKGYSIFLPAAGFMITRFISGRNKSGYYWSSSLCRQFPSYAKDVEFERGKISCKEDSPRNYGLSIRPVLEE